MAEGTPELGPPSAQLDLGRLSEISGGEVEFEREIVAEYIAQGWDLLEAATLTLESMDAAALRRYAHTLKGSSRTVGAEGVALVAIALEAAAAESVQGASALLGRARACLAVTEREFERHFREGRGRDAA